MAAQHWIDNLSAALAVHTPRRALLGWASALGLDPVLGSADLSAVAKNKGKGGGKKKGKGHDRPDRPKPPKQPDECDAAFSDTHNRDYCRLVRRQCDGDDPREFCIRDGTKPDGSPTKVAVCCKEGETCCDAYCCPEGHACCDGNQCCRAGHTCCGGACCGTNDPWKACCDGRCVDTEIHREHCGACGNACLPNEVCHMGGCVCTSDCDEECPTGLTRCGFNCVNTKTNRDHCGGCFAYNPNGLKCCDGNVCTYINGVCCGGTCYPEGWPSCD